MKNNKSIRHYFNLVEILLALGVVAIGICSVMVLFPIGANANRDASMETYIADVADQILRFAKYKLDTTPSYWTEYISADIGVLGYSNHDGMFCNFEDLQIVEDTALRPSDFDFVLSNNSINDTALWVKADGLVNANDMKTPIFILKGRPSLIQIAVPEVNNDDAIQPSLADILESGNLNYRAVAIFWATYIDGPQTPLSFGARLNIKIYWPAELPAAARKSATYSLDVYKKN